MSGARVVVERGFSGFDEAEGFVDVGDLNDVTEVETRNGLGHTNDCEKGTGRGMGELPTYQEGTEEGFVVTVFVLLHALVVFGGLHKRTRGSLLHWLEH